MESKIIKTLFIFTLLIANAYGAIPTIEGLFRNGINQDLSGDYAVLKILIEEIPNEELFSSVSASSGRFEDQKRTLLKSDGLSAHFLKLIFTNEREKVELLQVEYFDEKMENTALREVKFLPDIMTRVKQDVNTERSLFYSLGLMLALNNSDGMSNFLSRNGLNFKRNKDLMNPDKVALYERYKSYLLKKKENQGDSVEDKNPMDPQDEQKKQEVADLQKMPMYKSVEQIKLIRENGRFYWKVDLDAIQAYFSNENHHIRRLNVTTASGNIRVNFGEYILFDGIHQLPKITIFKDQNDRMYRITTLDFNTFKNQGKNIAQRADQYKALEKKIDIKDESEAKQPIMFLY